MPYKAQVSLVLSQSWSSPSRVETSQVVRCSKLVSMVEGVESIVRVMPKSDDALANGTRELVALSKNGVSAVTR